MISPQTDDFVSRLSSVAAEFYTLFKSSGGFYAVAQTFR